MTVPTWPRSQRAANQGVRLRRLGALRSKDADPNKRVGKSMVRQIGKQQSAGRLERAYPSAWHSPDPGGSNIPVFGCQKPAVIGTALILG